MTCLLNTVKSDARQGVSVWRRGQRTQGGHSLAPRAAGPAPSSRRSKLAVPIVVRHVHFAPGFAPRGQVRLAIQCPVSDPIERQPFPARPSADRRNRHAQEFRGAGLVMPAGRCGVGSFRQRCASRHGNAPDMRLSGIGRTDQRGAGACCPCSREGISEEIRLPARELARPGSAQPLNAAH